MFLTFRRFAPTAILLATASLWSVGVAAGRESCQAGGDVLVAAKASTWSYSIRGGAAYNGHGFPQLQAERMQQELCTERTEVLRLQSAQATVEAILTWDDDTLLLAFAGTTSEAARRQNLDADFGPYLIRGQQTHRGWSRAVLAAAPQLDARLRELAPGRRVLVTGHSSGGALAAYYLAAHLQRNSAWVEGAELITLGASRFSSPRFARWLQRAAHHRGVRMREVVSRAVAGRRRVADEVPHWRSGLSGVGRLVYLDLGRTDDLHGNEQLHDPWTYLRAAAEVE